ncbi:Putative BolA-like ATP binding protein [Candidatus Fokinia solitaria]|uniref:BolA-like ATP binding protein n=1 Tax=Candidatus Fokinia solitaria TaxID=1802984 RepID=A0A2U8BSW4_9RICK|nr:BolA/IbaG family iron-sulfur metabolism protein [Candidatus Fokinia solitaria]AWD33413.1 Putative BolA-like ATP binding protein [Candidatus Fokinia solitaria]
MKKRMTEALLQRFPDAVLSIQEIACDEMHYHISIQTAEFVGKTLLEQHKMVYCTIGEYVGNEVHAVKIKTASPSY